MMKIRYLILTVTIGLVSFFSTLSAERNIDLSLNKHNFTKADLLQVSASFAGFDDDPIVGDVYIDIIDVERDSVVMSATMKPTAASTFSSEINIPGNGFETATDVLKLSKFLTINEGILYGDGLPITIYCNSKSGQKSKTIFDFFEKVPLSEVEFISVRPWRASATRPLGEKGLILTVHIKEGFNTNDFFNVQVSGRTRSGEVVAAIEPITIHKICFVPYYGDNEQLNPKKNFLQSISYEDVVKHAFY